MPANLWIDELVRWLRHVGMSHEDIARKTKHNEKHVTRVLEGEASPQLGLYLDLLRGSGGCLHLVEEPTSSAAVCEKLRVAAESQGLGKARLGRALNRDRSTISRLLNGRVPNPSLKVIADLTDLLGLAGSVRIHPKRPSDRFSCPDAYPNMAPQLNDLLAHFRFSHLKPGLRSKSRVFARFAAELVATFGEGPHLMAALTHLLMIKDIMVRSQVDVSGFDAHAFFEELRERKGTGGDVLLAEDR